jgi:membrane protein YqaA with SNARE-associated domain
MLGNLPTVFFEAAHRASVIPLASEATIYALKSFGQSPMVVPVIVAIAGALLAHGVNWFLGRLMMKLPTSPRSYPAYQKLSAHFNRYGYLLLVFACLSLGNLLVLASGIFGTPLKKVLPPVALGLIYYYGRLLA